MNHTLSPTKKSFGISADRPKGAVKLSWKWPEFEADMQANLARLNQDMLKQLGIVDSSNDMVPSSKCLPKVFELLFEYTPQITEARLLSKSFDPSTVLLGHVAHLRDIDWPQGEFTIEVPLHDHLLVSLRVQVSPASALLRSKNDIFDQMKHIHPFLNEHLAAVKFESSDVKRLKRQEATITAALDSLPDAKPEELVLVTIHTLIHGSADSKGTGWTLPNTVAKHLTKFRPQVFQSVAQVKSALQVLGELGAIEPTRPRQRLALKPKGREHIKALLKK